MGRITDLFEKIYLNVLELRIRLQESTIRTAVEKKLLLEEKAVQLEIGKCSDEYFNAEIQRRILNVCEGIKKRSGSRIAYRYKKITDSFAYSSVKNLFKLPRRFSLLSKLAVYISTVVAVIETSAFALTLVIMLILSLPFTLVGYTVYGTLGKRRFEKFAKKLALDSEKGVTVLIYSTNDKRKIKNINASAYAKNGRSVLKINGDQAILTMNVGIDRYGCYYAGTRFREYMEKNNVISTDDITVIRL